MGKIRDLQDALGDFELIPGIEDAGGDDPDEVQRSFIRYWMSTGITALNFLISLDPFNGFPFGRSILLYGPSGHGKSLWMYKWMSMVIHLMGGYAFLLDIERGLEKRWVQELGLDQEPFIRVYRKKKPNQTHAPKMKIEHVFGFFHKLAKMVDSGWNLDPKTGQRRPIIVGWDSVSGTMSEKEFDLMQLQDEKDGTEDESPFAKKQPKDPTKNNYQKPAFALSEGFRNSNTVLADRDILLVMLSQERTDMQAAMTAFNWRMAAGATKDTGGKAPTFYSSLKMRVYRKNYLYHDPEARSRSLVVGQTNVFECEKSRLGPEGWSLEVPIYYLDGIDDTEATFQFLEDRRIIHKSGTKCTMQLPDTVDIDVLLTTCSQLAPVPTIGGAVQFNKKDWAGLFGDPWFFEAMSATVKAWIDVQRHRKVVVPRGKKVAT